MEKKTTEYLLKRIPVDLWKDFNTAVILNQTTMKDILLKAAKNYVKRNKWAIDKINNKY